MCLSNARPFRTLYVPSKQRACESPHFWTPRVCPCSSWFKKHLLDDQSGECLISTPYTVYVELQGQRAGGPAQGGACWATGRVSLGLAEATTISVFSQRLAYGITPENEHHLVAQRDVRQFQVSVAQTVWGRACEALAAPCCAWSLRQETTQGIRRP